MKKRKVTKIGLFLVTCALLIVYVFPFWVILINSFKERRAILDTPLALPTAFSLENYTNASRSMEFMSAITNSLVITVSSLIITILFASMFAYFLVRWKWKLNKWIFGILVLSMLIPFQVVMIPFVNIFGGWNLLDRQSTLIFAYLGFGIAQATFLYHGFIKSLPIELEEAAMIDGASKLRVFFSVVFPMLKPISSTIAIVNVLWFWNDFLLPSLVLQSPGNRTIPLSTSAFFGRFSTDFGSAMAALILAVIPMLVFYLICQKQILKGMVEGALK